MQKNHLLIIVLLIFFSCGNEDPYAHISLADWKDNSKVFRADQLRYQRVRHAYTKKASYIKKMLKSKDINTFDFDLYLRAFKQEEVLELWVKEKQETSYRHLVDYPFCKNSGQLGPKRKEGDLQIPEGFYHINYYNPKSTFHLSLKLNYPNASDLILSDPIQPGGDIYIHGGCATVGCIPITNMRINELYILAIEAKKKGQQIPIDIYPIKFENGKWNQLQNSYKNRPDLVEFWAKLKAGFDYFEQCKKTPQMKVSETGEYQLAKVCK